PARISRIAIPIFAGSGTLSRKLLDSASIPIVKWGSLVNAGASDLGASDLGGASDFGASDFRGAGGAATGAGFTGGAGGASNVEIVLSCGRAAGGIGARDGVCPSFGC